MSLLDELKETLIEAGQIARGEAEPAIAYEYTGLVLTEVKVDGKSAWKLAREGQAALDKIADQDFDSIPELLLAIRHGLRQPQVAMAHMLGVSPSTYEKWEQGQREPRGPGRTLLGTLMINPLAVMRGRTRIDALVAT
jgi:DNA-binding transcriptional regulator YiaG